MAAQRPVRLVLYIGSSGGGAATLGHADPAVLRAALDLQLASVGAAGARIAGAQVVACDVALDFAADSDRAALWASGVALPAEARAGEGDDELLICVLRGSLAQVNAHARLVDARLAAVVRAGGCDGLVAVSADARAGGANAGTLEAAGAMRVPLAGTGGSSLALAAATWGCALVGNAGGSVATTAISKSIGIAAALAGEWGEPFAPAAVGGAGCSSAGWHSPIDGSLPAFLACACALAAAERAGGGGGGSWLARALPGGGGVMEAFATAVRGGALCAVLGAVTAAHRSGLGELSVLGGALVGGLARDSSVAAFLGAWALGGSSARVLALSARGGMPATAASLLVGGALPVAVGAAALALAPAAAALTGAARAALARVLGGGALGSFGWAARAARGGVGGICGVSFAWGSRRGWYHSLFLPAMLIIEMERGALPLLGALDLVTLCAAGAGACAAQLARPRRASAAHDGALAWRGLRINLMYGDYVEACYPFLEREPALAGAYYAGASRACCARRAGQRRPASRGATVVRCA
jgi:hypothetical protein